jgi:YVTN family beta-propeller protein
VNDTSFFTFQGDWQAFVTNNEDDTVTVIDAVTDSVITTITVGPAPNPLDILPDGSKAYIGNTSDGTLSVIDTATDTVSNTISTTTNPFDIVVMVVTPDGSKNYIVNQSSNNVTVIDNASETVIATIPVGDRPFNIALTPDGTKAYVLNANDNTVSVISIASDTVIATIPVGVFPIAASATPDSTKVYVLNFLDSTVSVISTVSDTVIATIPVGSNPRGVAVNPNGSEVLVTNSGSSSVSVISTASNTVIATITVGSGPNIINITPDGTQAYVVNENDGTVSAIDLATNTVTATIPAAPTGDIEAQTITPDGKKVYEADFDNNLVVVIDTATNTVAGTIPTGREPSAVQITPDQAPLAQFTIFVQNAGLPTSFDASQSVSPTGTIANYFWDFGDGSPTVNTASPFITHIYQAPGTYFVTLIVTNTAGTSLTQIFYFASASSDFSQTGSPVTNNNGGPTAERIHLIMIGIAPPSNFTGCIKKNAFLNKTEFTLRATFTASPFPGVIFYRVFINGKVVLEIPANGLLSFTICLKSKQSAGEFSIAAVGPGNVESIHVPITITGSCCSFR